MITTIKQYRTIFEKKNDFTDLIICDVQENFKKFFNNTYLLELKKFAEDFTKVYQIYDTIEGDEDYYFPNQIESYEKQYGGELTVDDVEHYFNTDVQETLYQKFENVSFDEQDKFETKTGDYYVFIGYDKPHEWFYCPKELSSLFITMAEQKRKVCLVGGAEGECIYDIYETMRSFGVDVEYDREYVYSYKGCNFQDEDQDIELDRFLNEIELDEVEESKTNIKVYEEIPDELYIDKVIDVFSDVEELVEGYGNNIETTNLINRTVGKSDILWITCLLKPRNKSTAYPMGEMGVIKVKVMETFYGLNKLKQLSSKDKIL